MNERYFAGLDLQDKEGAFCIFDKETQTLVAYTTRKESIRFWLFMCRIHNIRVLAEITPSTHCT